MFWKTITLVALLVRDTSAQVQGSADFLRFGCSQLVIERIDPLVTPGANPSPHTHQIVGGNSFNTSVKHLSVFIRDHIVNNTPDGS